MPHEILSETRNGALIITFNRPEHGNAFNKEMAQQFFQLVKTAATDRAIRVIVLRGAAGTFMNGLDLSIYSRDTAAGIEQNNELFPPYHSTIRELYSMEKPVLAVVEGRVAGVGLSLMLASDIVIAARGTKFNANFTSYAMSPDGGISFFLPRKVGMARASEILMLGDDFDAEAALHLNLVNQVVDDSALDAAATAWTERLAAGPTKAYGAIKRLVGKAFDHDINAHLALEHSYWGATARSFDFRSAIKGLFAKQPVKYTGA